MQTTQAAPPIPAPAKPRRRRWRVILVGLAIVIAVMVGFWGYTALTTRAAWAEAEAEAERDLPRWRLSELEDDRPALADAVDSGALMMAIHRKSGKMPGGGWVAVGVAPNYDKIFENLPPTAQLNRQQSELIRGRLGLIAKLLEEARTLKDMPRGRLPFKFAPDGASVLLPHHQDVRGIAEWLQHDAWLLAHDEEYDKAIESCQAILVGSRVFETDVSLIAFLIRCACQNLSVLTLERVLAQGQASDESLRVLQAALDRETKDSGWLQAVRGERAMTHHVFCAIRDGKFQGNLFGYMGPGSGSPDFTVESVELWLADRYPSVLLKHYPELLHLHNKLVEVSKLPLHERRLKVKELDDEHKSSRNLVVKLIWGGVARCSQTECRTQVMLRSALVAVACERYRLKSKNRDWPASLDVLVKEKLLDEIPMDPFDNQPMRYRRTREGIVVYSIGFDMTDNQGKIDRDRIYDAGVDLGFRVWNVERRRQRALPAVVLEGKN